MKRNNYGLIERVMKLFYVFGFLLYSTVLYVDLLLFWLNVTLHNKVSLSAIFICS